MDDGATVRLHCVQCGRCTVYQGRLLLKLIGDRQMLITNLQARARCHKCKGTAEVIVTFPQLTIEQDRKSQVIHSPFAVRGGRLWQW